VVDVLDGAVRAHRTFAEGRAAGFRHRQLFPRSLFEGIESGRCQFFFWDAVTKRIELAWISNVARLSGDALTAFREAVQVQPETPEAMPGRSD